MSWLWIRVALALPLLWPISSAWASELADLDARLAERVSEILEARASELLATPARVLLELPPLPGEPLPAAPDTGALDEATPGEPVDP